MIKIIKNLINYFVKYIFLIIILFFFIIFTNNESNIPLFLNFSPKNFQVDVQLKIDDYIKNPSKENIEQINQLGSLFYPYFFEIIEKNTIYKDEYIQLYKDLNLNLFTIESEELFNIEAYKSGWKSIKEYYNKKVIIANIYKWKLTIINDTELLTYLNEVGTFALFYIIEEIVLNYDLAKYNEIKPLIQFVISKNITPFKEAEIDIKKYDIFEWLLNYYSKNKNYFNELTFSTKFKTMLTQTQFYRWFIEAITFDFGTKDDESLYKIVISNFKTSCIIYLLFVILNFTIILLKKTKKIFLTNPYLILIIMFSEYFFKFDGIFSLFFKSLESKNYYVLNISILFIGILMIFLNILKDIFKKFYKNETNII